MAFGSTTDHLISLHSRIERDALFTEIIIIAVIASVISVNAFKNQNQDS